DVADLARDLVNALFDPYRPELHYMRGPGPKWRAKHEQTLKLARSLATVPSLALLARQSIGRRDFIRAGPLLMLRLGLFLIAFLSTHAPTSKRHTSNCAQVSDLPAARLRWAAARQSRNDAAQDEKKCRAYRVHFYDAVTARQAASICEDGINRQRD